MAITKATDIMMDLADEWEEAIPSAVLSGINGDADHQAKPGKHLSRSDNIRKWGSSCWPVTHANDKLGPSDKACAIDINMNRTDQNKVHKRFVNVFNNRKTDPRAKFLYAFNGWDGEGVPCRYNLVTGAVDETDDSHKWHEHVETFYGFVNDPKMKRAIMSIVTGETVAQYLGEDMLDATDKEWLRDNLPDIIWNHIPAADWANMQVQIRNIFQQLSGKVGNLPGNQNNFTDWRMTQDVVAVKTSLSAIQATLAQLSGKDYVNEDEIIKGTSDAVIARLGEGSDEELAAVLAGVVGADRLLRIAQLAQQ